MTWVSDSNVALLTDLYELTMSASYFARGMNGQATFDLFVRDLPGCRNFLVSCGLEQALEYLEDLHFDPDSIDYLRSLQMFDEEFLDYLGRFRFTGDVCAVAEGEVVFEREPILRVTAPLIEAQIVETFLLNCITFQTMVASKAARVALASGDKIFVDFSLRRDHAADAGLKAARAAFVAGAAATSNLLAGKIYGIPVSGTMAHSYVMAFPSEMEAFRAFASDFPGQVTLLIDTFDTEEGARRAVKVAKELAEREVRLNAVRIDSGDLDQLSRSVRKILDDAGFSDVKIFLSGDLDEYRIRDLCREGVPADAFGVGTQLGTSADSPFLGGVYKLVADEGGAKVKLSTKKATLPGVKQVYRMMEGGHISKDVVALHDEDVSGGRPLLQQVMQSGKRTREPESLADLRARCESALASLPERLRGLDMVRPGYPVEESPELKRLVQEMRERAR